MLSLLFDYSEINATASLFPIPVTRRVRAASPAYFLRGMLAIRSYRGIIAVGRLGPGCGRLDLIVRVLNGHNGSMPDRVNSCMVTG